MVRGIGIVVRAAGLVWAVMLAAAASPTMAAPAYEGLGFWSVEVSGDRCVASVVIGGGQIFEFNTLRGEVGFEAFAAKGKAMPRGDRALFEADAYTFTFKPEFTEDAHVIYIVDTLDADDLAAIRAASFLRLSVDGQLAVSLMVKDTHLSQALDAAIACSNGQRGWWGDGVPVSDAKPPVS